MNKIKLDFTHDRQVAAITLGDGKGNVLDYLMMEELQAAFDAFKNESGLKLITFEGAGKHFSFGASVEEHQREYAATMLRSFHQLFLTLRELSIPTLAKVSGQCLGGGMELAIMCNFLFADRSARMGQPEIVLGVFPPPASIILPEKIGLARAEELLLTGRSITGEEAKNIGLVNEVFEDKTALQEGVERWIEQHILPKSASSLRFAVKAARAKFNHVLGNFLPQLEYLYVNQLMATADANEGISAFLEKRKPAWSLPPAPSEGGGDMTPAVTPPPPSGGAGGRLGVVGAGTMGAAMAQKFAQEGFEVWLADLSQAQVERGLADIRNMLAAGVERKVFTEEQAQQTLAHIHGTDKLEDLKNCDLVVEAIFENFEAKNELFKKLSGIVPPETILATNTSSFSVSELAAAVSRPERFIGLHYFYHAAKNRLVEIIPGEKTSQATLDACYRFSILSGKDPIFTKDRYGFAVNRFFVPWLNEAVRLLDEAGGINSAATIDAVCMKTFGIGMGPFALMNATGVPIALHAQRTLASFGPSYQPAAGLVRQVESGQTWGLEESPAPISPEAEKTVAERMLGCAFFVCSQILEEKICGPAELNRGAKIGLRWKKGPVELMLQFGENEVRRLVQQYANLYGEKMPAGIAAGNWKMEYVRLEKRGDRAIVTLDRPEDLNALNEEVVAQLDRQFSIAEADPAVKTIFLTGSGKAFVAGADIRFFVKNMKAGSLENIVSFTKYGQQVFEKVDRSPKQVVALLNGLALGGGLELALCADMILATPKASMAFPETGIGIYPGLGGTQRTAAKVGKGLAKYLILTGKMLNATEAAETGLVDAVISQEEAFDILDGSAPLPQPAKVRPGGKPLGGKWEAIRQLYERNSLSAIMSGDYVNGSLSGEEVAKLCNTMSRKAPVAMRIAEQLIEQGGGSVSELEHLTTIFSTSDALLGLTSVGKQVAFEGR